MERVTTTAPAHTLGGSLLFLADPCGENANIRHNTQRIYLIDVDTFQNLPHCPYTLDTHSLNSYFPVLSTASNSILASSTPLALSSSLQPTLSPGFTGPTPDGVPVRITSPD